MAAELTVSVANKFYRWFRSMFFKTTIVEQLEWNHSRLSRDSSLREEVKNSTIALLHARRSVRWILLFFFNGTALELA
jgi:hypothetical protein